MDSEFMTEAAYLRIMEMIGELREMWREALAGHEEL